MNSSFNFKHFIKAQKSSYPKALREIANGKKVSHWMWYIFPQLRGLGISRSAKKYSISGIEEAVAYLADPILGQRLIEISEILLELPSNDASEIFGHPDDLKLQSCMTLFAASVPHNTYSVFQKVLDKYFDGHPRLETGPARGLSASSALKALEEKWLML